MVSVGVLRRMAPGTPGETRAERAAELAKTADGVPVWSVGVYVDDVPHELLLTRDGEERQKLCFTLWDPKQYVDNDDGTKGRGKPWKWYDLRDVVAVHSGLRHRSVFPIRLTRSGRPKADSVVEVFSKYRPGTAAAKDASHAWRMFLYILHRRRKGRWALKRLRIDFPDGALCIKWREEILRRLKVHCPFRPQRLLVFVNPFGGKKKAVPIFEREVLPILAMGGVKVEMILTERANHARDLLLSRKDIDSFDGVVSVGGDGLYNEILVGLVRRQQKLAGQALDTVNEELARPTIRIGIIPAGSTNGLCHTIHGNGDPTTAALHILLGDSSGIDVCGVYGGDERLLRFASTMVSMGFLGDALKLSERMRCLGPIRYQVAGFRTWIKHPTYGGQVAFRPKFSEATGASIPSMISAFKEGRLSRCRADCSVCTSTSLRGEKGGKALSRDNSLEAGALSLRHPQHFPHHITGDFSHVVGVITPCISDMSPEGLSPAGHLGDGSMDLGLLSHISRRQNFAFMTKTVLGQDHMQANFVHMYRVSRFSFTMMPDEEIPKPLDFDTAKEGEKLAPLRRVRAADAPDSARTASLSGGGAREGDKKAIWNIDGELLFQHPQETLTFRVHRQLVRVFARGIEPNESRDAVRTTKCGCISKPVSTAID